MRIVYGIVLGVTLQVLMFSGTAKGILYSSRIQLSNFVLDAAVELSVQEGDNCVDILHHLRDARKHRFVAMEAVPGVTNGIASIVITTQRNSRRKPETSIVHCKFDTEDFLAQSQSIAVAQETSAVLGLMILNMQARGVQFSLTQETRCAEGLTMLRQNRLKVMDKAIIARPKDEAFVTHVAYYLEESGGKRKTALLLCAQ